MELLQAFGIDVRLLIANLINFLLLVGILYKLGYQPILKFVHDRQSKIEKGLSHAEEAHKKLTDAGAEQEAILAQAHKEAQTIISTAREQAQVQAEGIIKKTQDESRAIVDRAKKEIRLEQEKSVSEVRAQATQLVLDVTEKLLHEKMDAKKDAALVQDMIKKS